MSVGAQVIVSNKITELIALPSANDHGAFWLLSARAPTFGLSLEKSNSQESEALRNRL